MSKVIQEQREVIGFDANGNPVHIGDRISSFCTGRLGTVRERVGSGSAKFDWDEAPEYNQETYILGIVEVLTESSTDNSVEEAA